MLEVVIGREIGCGPIGIGVELKSVTYFSGMPCPYKIPHGIRLLFVLFWF